MSTEIFFKVFKENVEALCVSYMDQLKASKDLMELYSTVEMFSPKIEAWLQKIRQEARRSVLQKKIEEVNQQTNLTDDDITFLTVNEMDEYSYMEDLRLFGIIQFRFGEQFAADLNHLFKTKTQKAYKSKVMMWVCRGLTVDHAITIVKLRKK